jgi:predicted DNA-binding transcriptional regulator AlpA
MDNMNFEQPNNEKRLDPLIKLREVAKIIDRSERHVWREIANGKLPRPVPGSPARLFQSDVQKYLNHLRDERDKQSASGRELVGVDERNDV